MKLAYLALSLFLIAPQFGFTQSQQVVQNFGFIQGNIWYSKDPFFVGDKIRIYTGVFNGSSEDIVGSVEFFDNEALIGRSEFSAVGGGKLREVWLDWTAIEGNHTISAKIAESKISKAGGQTQDVTPAHNRSGQDVRFIDTDTDKDNVGNREDTDDDNDGVIDIDEKKAGTDPIKKDTDGDGFDDKEDVDPLVKNEKPSALASTTQAVVAKLASSTPNILVKAVEAINNFTDTQVEKLEDKKEELKAEIEEIKAQEQQLAIIEEATPGGVLGTDVKKDPETGVTFVAGPESEEQTIVSPRAKSSSRRLWKEFYLLLISVATFVLKHKILMYLVAAIVLYNIIRLTFRFIRHRRQY